MLPRVRVNSERLGGLTPRVKVVTAIGIIAVLALSFIVYFIFQSNYEHQIRSTVFEQQRQQQVAYAKSVSSNIRSDLESIQVRLQVIAQSEQLETGDFTSSLADSMIQQVKQQIQTTVPIDSIGVIDKDGKIAYNSEGKYQAAVGQDRSFREWVVATRTTLSPIFSIGYHGQLSGTMDVAITYPIVDRQSGDYLGLVVATLNIEDYLAKYGNIVDATNQFLGFYDRNFTLLASPFKEAVGYHFSDPILHETSTPAADAHFQKVFSGQSSVGVFSYRTGERLNAGEPIIIGGKPQYFLFVVTPTAAIYKQIDSVIDTQRTEFYLLQAAIAGAIAIALYFLLRWSRTIEETVKERTSELESANKQLQAHDKMQQEFINIAAHELRTPVQPIIAMAEILGVYPAKAEDEDDEGEVRVKKKDLRIIGRNAARLERLSSDILAASKIETSELRLNIDRFDINMLIHEAIEDAKRHIEFHGLAITSNAANKAMFVEADRSRIMQVLTNLLNNSIRFTQPSGAIAVTVMPTDGIVKVTVTDTGKGISGDVLPKLFSRFSSSVRDGSGTGLGLFISKAIIEAHGGSIWGANNPDGRGATFGFEIPVKALNDTTQRSTLESNFSNSLLPEMAKEAFGKP